MDRLKRWCRYLGPGGICLGLLGCAPAIAQPTAVCRPADIDVVPARLDYFRRVLSDTTTEHAAAFAATREAFELSPAASSSVRLVADESLCRAALAALNRVREEPGTHRRLWVYSLGPAFAVEDPDLDIPPGDYRPLYLFDRSWRYKMTMVGI